MKKSTMMRFCCCGAAAGLFGLAVLSGLIDAPGQESAADEPTAVAGAPASLPDGELGRVVALGKAIVEDTGRHPLSKMHVGNGLTCQSCHLEAGTHPEAASLLSVATAYPAWSPREQRVITLEDRVLNCFMRSMNGVRPPNGSEVSVAVTTYISWLSSGEQIAMNGRAALGPRHVKPLKTDVSQANISRGETLYQAQCSVCHGDDGAGTDDGPAVWGPMSYNNGAGLSRNDKLAAWLKVAMPLGDPSLSEQEALDLAAYVNSKPRSKFVLKDHLPEPHRLGEYNARQ